MVERAPEALMTSRPSTDRARLVATIGGVPVRRRNGDRIGTIERFMIDKRSGRVDCAIMAFGGFLGIGDEEQAVPWYVLSYNEVLDSYEVNLTEDELRAGAVPPGGGEEAVSVELSLDGMGDLLERLDKGIAAEHRAMDRLLERLSSRTPV